MGDRGHQYSSKNKIGSGESSNGRSIKLAKGFSCGHQYVHSEKMTAAAVPITGFCIEPMPSTFSKLTQFMFSDMNLDKGEIHLVNQAMGDLEGNATFIDAPAGTTNVGLFRAKMKGMSRVSVNVSNLDRLISAHAITDVDFLSIDSEGEECLFKLLVV